MDPVDSLVRLLLRLILVPLGYLCAVLAGAAVILVGEWRIGTLFDTPQPDEAALGLVVAVVAAGTLVALLVSAMWLAAAAGILFSELFAVRSWMFHAANGAISAWIGAQMLASDGQANAVVHDPFYVVAAGLAGGLTYWLVAGCTAGFFRPVLRQPSQRAARLPPPEPPSPPPGAA
ncbi:hypothetical protein V5F38_00325 [Xanthobacter sp. V0B-10]|uniref:hypothetical protein n=1 Tax=Xanthobacter albus TaxID=3119929 RepID=UPI00372BC3BF